ncbi:MAG: hypothetical protein JWO87_1833 [Phycisphaerales bacterium]|nr:hypothetical protein [Phycisphaerales bacterium]
MQNENSVTESNVAGILTRVIRFAAFAAAAVFIVVRVLTAQGEVGDSSVMTVMCILTGVLMAFTGIMSLSRTEMF